MPQGCLRLGDMGFQQRQPLVFSIRRTRVLAGAFTLVNSHHENLVTRLPGTSSIIDPERSCAPPLENVKRNEPRVTRGTDRAHPGLSSDVRYADLESVSRIVRCAIPDTGVRIEKQIPRALRPRSGPS